MNAFVALKKLDISGLAVKEKDLPPAIVVPVFPFVNKIQWDPIYSQRFGVCFGFSKYHHLRFLCIKRTINVEAEVTIVILNLKLLLEFMLCCQYTKITLKYIIALERKMKRRRRRSRKRRRSEKKRSTLE